MKGNIVKKILEKIQQPELVDTLVNNLNPTDMQSVLLEVYRRRADKQTSKKLFEQYIENRFVQAAKMDPEIMLRFDQLAMSLVNSEFDAIELSPVAPLGSNSIIAPVDQNNTIATIRNTEVCSDPTNVMALECAKRRKELLSKYPKSIKKINLCTSHRVIRAQLFNEPGAFPHFKIFSLCSAGRDEGANKFEINSTFNHVKFYIDLLLASSELELTVTKIKTLFLPLNTRTSKWLNDEFIAKFNGQFPEVKFEVKMESGDTISYYKNLRFQVFATDKSGMEFLLVDGGFTDWTQQLLSNKKERLLTSGIGSERLLVCFK